MEEPSDNSASNDHKPQRLSSLLLSEMYNAGIIPDNPPSPRKGQGTAAKLTRKVSGEKGRKYNMKQTRPDDLPIIGTAYTKQEPGTVSPVYDVACVDSPDETGRKSVTDHADTDASLGYLQPMDINPKLDVRTPPQTTTPKPYISVYNDQRAARKNGTPTELPSPIYDVTGVHIADEGFYDPVAPHEQHNQDIIVSKKKTRGFPKWNRNKGAIKNKDKKKAAHGGSGGSGGGNFSLKNLFKFGNRKERNSSKSSHVYAEPDIMASSMTTSDITTTNTITADAPPDKYSQFVRSSGAIYGNDRATNNQDRPMSLDNQPNDSNTSKPSRLRQFFEVRKLPECLTEMPRCHRIVCIVIIVVIVLLLLSSIGFIALRPMNLRASCPSDQYAMAGAGINGVPVSWKEGDLQDISSSRKPGDIFPSGRTTVVTYAGNVCSFNVTVEAEGRPSNQITLDTVTTTLLSISWSVPAFNPASTGPLTYHVHIVNQYGRLETVNSSVMRDADSGIRALSYQLTDLIPGYGYLIVVEGLELMTNVSGYLRTEPNPPGKVQQNTGHLPDSSAITITWLAAVGFFTKYQISYKSHDNTQPIIAGVVDRDITDYIIYMLDESTSYTIIVQTVSGSVLSVPSMLSVRTGPKLLHLSGVYETSIIVTCSYDNYSSEEQQFTRFWLQLDVKDGNTGYSSIPNYIYQGPMATPNGAYKLPTDDLVQEFPGLVPGQVYRVTISDVPLGQDPVRLDVLYARTLPAQPTNVQVLTQEIVDKNARVRIGWTPPSVGIHTGFVVTWAPGNGHPGSPIELGHDAVEITIDGLDVDTTYTQGQVRSISGGVGRFRQESGDLTQSINFLVQKLPNDFIIKDVTHTALTIAWNIIDDEDITTSSVRILSPSGKILDEKVTSVYDDTEGEYTFSQLSAGQNYTIILSVSQIPTSRVEMKRDLASITTTTVPNMIIGLYVTHVTPNSLSLKWEHSDGEYTDFTVIYRSTDDNAVSMTTSTRDTQLELRDLSSNTEYIVTVVTVSGERWSEPVVIKEYTAPIPSGKLSVRSFTSRTIDISWGRSYNPLVTGYTVQAMTEAMVGQDQHETAQQQKSIGELQTTFFDLFPGRLYSISLRVIGLPDPVETYLQHYTRPEQPSNLQLQIDYSNGQANLMITWNPVSSNIDKYLVETRNSPDEDFETLMFVDAMFGNTQSRISGIDQYTTYYVRVYAIIDHGGEYVRSEPAELSKRHL